MRILIYYSTKDEIKNMLDPFGDRDYRVGL